MLTFFFFIAIIPEMHCCNSSENSLRPPAAPLSLSSALEYWSVSPAGQQHGPLSLSDPSVSIIRHTINTDKLVGKGWKKKGEGWRKYSHSTYLQNLDIGLVRVGHLHAVDLYEAERLDLLLLCCLLQRPDHLVYCGSLPCARNARDIHTPVEHQAHGMQLNSN